MASRRGFLVGLLAAGMAPRPSWADVNDPKFLSAAQTADGSFSLMGLDAVGGITFAIPLPARGHAAAAHPIRPEAVAFARRPGTFAFVIDCLTGNTIAKMAAPEGRHFYGHGVFSVDGQRLFTSENDYEIGAGIIGVWDCSDGYRRMAEFSSGGIGPHELHRIAGSDHLVIANGGIDTHPETGRAKLNLPTMRPNLCYLALNGDILEQASLPDALHQNSIRHLAVRNDGLVGFAMQWQGTASGSPPLLGFHRLGAQMRMVAPSPEQLRVMNGYAGSVAFSADGSSAAITSPRGGMLQVFDVVSGQQKYAKSIADVCGVATGRDGFTLTSGTGMIATLDQDGKLHHMGDAPVRWDNHLVRL